MFHIDSQKQESCSQSHLSLVTLFCGKFLRLWESKATVLNEVLGTPCSALEQLKTLLYWKHMAFEYVVFFSFPSSSLCLLLLLLTLFIVTNY